jgi:hypothetical protein
MVPVRVPDEAGSGSAKVTVSFPDWKEARVAPATSRLRVVPAAAAGGPAREKKKGN